MKKIVTLLLCFSVLFCGLAYGEEEKKEILFRGVPWGSSVVESFELLKDFTWVVESAPDREADSFLQISGVQMNEDEHEQGITLMAHAGAETGNAVSVAGYPVRSMRMYFAFTPEGERLTYCHEDTAFYVGAYDFDGENGEEVFENLKRKLISLYGEAEQDGPLGDVQVCLWSDSKWNVLMLDQVTSASGKEVHLYYINGKFNELLHEADEAVRNERMRDGIDTVDVGSVDGL